MNEWMINQSAFPNETSTLSASVTPDTHTHTHIHTHTHTHTKWYARWDDMNAYLPVLVSLERCALLWSWNGTVALSGKLGLPGQGAPPLHDILPPLRNVSARGPHASPSDQSVSKVCKNEPWGPYGEDGVHPRAFGLTKLIPKTGRSLELAKQTSLLCHVSQDPNFRPDSQVSRSAQVSDGTASLRLTEWDHTFYNYLNLTFTWVLRQCACLKHDNTTAQPVQLSRVLYHSQGDTRDRNPHWLADAKYYCVFIGREVCTSVGYKPPKCKLHPFFSRLFSQSFGGMSFFPGRE